MDKMLKNLFDDVVEEIRAQMRYYHVDGVGYSPKTWGKPYKKRLLMKFREECSLSGLKTIKGMDLNKEFNKLLGEDFVRII